MERFLKRHQDRLIGSIAGFDRILFRGTLRSISYVEGLNYFMGNQRVGFKDFAGSQTRRSLPCLRLREGGGAGADAPCGTSAIS